MSPPNSIIPLSSHRPLPSFALTAAFMIVGIAVLALGIGPWYFGFAAMAAALTLAALVSPLNAVLLLLLAAPFWQIIRAHHPGSFILAGALELFIVIIVFAWLGRHAQSHKNPLLSSDLLILFFLFLWGLLPFLAQGQFQVALLGFRDYMAALLLYPVLRSELRRLPLPPQRLLACLVAPAFVIAALSLADHFGNFGIVTTVHADELHAQQRSILGFSFSRLPSLIGGGPSAAGIYFIAVGTMTFFALTLLKIKSRPQKAFLLTAAVLLLLAAVFTVSNSIVIGILISLLGLMLWGRKTPHRFAAAALALALFFLFVITPNIGQSSISERITFNSFAWTVAVPTTPQGLLWGNGYITAGGNLLDFSTDDSRRPESLIDGGWATLLWIYGLPGALLALLFWAPIVWSALAQPLRAPAPDDLRLQLYARTLFLCLLGSVHTLPFARRGISILFVVAAALIAHYAHRKPAPRPVPAPQNHYPDESTAIPHPS